MIEITKSLIISKYRSLFNDGDTDIIFIGKNIDNETIIGSIRSEDDDILSYFHLIVSQETKENFLSRTIAYRQVFREAKSIYIVKTNYANTLLEVNEVNLIDIEQSYLPFENVFLPLNNL